MKLYYSIVECSFDTEGLLQILSEAVNSNADEVVLLAELEWDIPALTLNIVNMFKKNHIKLSIVFCSNYDEYYAKLFSNIGMDKNNVSFWGTYWLNWSKENLNGVEEFKNPTFDPDKIIHPFITLNNRSHLHRCAFIDELSSQNLIDKGVVTWVKHLNENFDYPYKSFDNREILLDDDFKTKLDSFLIPKEFNKSLFHIVTEATHKTLIISEKTAIPLFMKKPFFVLSAKGYHKILVDLGFKLYDEIIDYSFDDIDDLHVRTQKFVSNIHNILPLNYKETYELLRPKLEYNFNKVNEIIHDINYIPKIIKDRYYENKKTNCQQYITDDRYRTFMQNCGDI